RNQTPFRGAKADNNPLSLSYAGAIFGYWRLTRPRDSHERRIARYHGHDAAETARGDKHAPHPSLQRDPPERRLSFVRIRRRDAAKNVRLQHGAGVSVDARSAHDRPRRGLDRPEGSRRVEGGTAPERARDPRRWQEVRSPHVQH